MHRDIKPQNVLLSSRGDVSLTDFNCATSFELELPSRDCVVDDQSGTLSYMAPECLGENPLCTWKADIWSLGLVMLDMFRDRIVVRGLEILWLDLHKSS